MVIFQTPGGNPGYNQFETLDDAVAFVEQLRNERDVTNARMFALEEIKFELKPSYFKVELQALNVGSSAEPAPESPAPAPASFQAPAPSEPAPPLSDAPPPAAPAAPAAAPASTFGAFSEGQTETAPEPPAPEQETPAEQPARRGLFGR